MVEKYIDQVNYNVPKEFTDATLRTATAPSTQTLPRQLWRFQKVSQAMGGKRRIFITNMGTSDEEDDSSDSDDE